MHNTIFALLINNSSPSLIPEAFRALGGVAATQPGTGFFPSAYFDPLTTMRSVAVLTALPGPHIFQGRKVRVVSCRHCPIVFLMPLSAPITRPSVRYTQLRRQNLY